MPGCSGFPGQGGSVPFTDATELQGFIHDYVKPGATVYTDDNGAYINLAYPHTTVQHKRGKYVQGAAHTRTGLSRSGRCSSGRTKGTYHKMSPKHLNRYVNEFAGRHNIRELDTLEQMKSLVARMAGRRLRYPDLVSA